MRVNPNNQSPAGPEDSEKREKRRQKACAFRTFETMKILFQAVTKTSNGVQERKERCLSIQIDTFNAVPVLKKYLSGTGLSHHLTSCDRTTMTVNIIKHLPDDTYYYKDDNPPPDNINRIARHRSLAKEIRNA